MEKKDLSDLLNDNWGDWEAMFDIMIQNQLHFEGDAILDSSGNYILDTSNEEVANLLYDYFCLYCKNKPSNQPLSKRKSKYISLC